MTFHTSSNRADLRPARLRGGAVRSGLVLAGVVGLSACNFGPPPPGPPGPAPAVVSSMDISSEALLIEDRTKLDGARQIVFDWSWNEQGGRASGRGVARLESPYKARIDLFAENLEAVAAAALVNDETRFPSGAGRDEREMVPPGPLLWAAFGVFRPGANAALMGGETPDDGSLILRYGVGEGMELRYHLRDRTVFQAELLDGGHVVERVVLEEAGPDGLPSEATYRHLGEFRELKVSIDQVEHVDAYPPDIWSPGR